MGWNSWNHFGDKVNDADIRAAADAMVASGMRDAGYVYVNIDDGWEGERDANGNIIANQQVSGYEGPGRYVHSKGIEVGNLFLLRDRTLAGGHEGSYGHEQQDANTYA